MEQFKISNDLIENLGNLKKDNKVMINKEVFEVLRLEPDANTGKVNGKMSIIEEWFNISLFNKNEDEFVLIVHTFPDKYLLFRKIERKSISEPWVFDIVEEIVINNIEII